MKRWISGAIVVAAAAGGMYYYVNRPVASAGDQDADYVIQSTELFAAFESDEVSANTKFTGKIIEINGPVSSIDVATRTVTIAGPEDMFGVSCEIAPEFATDLQVLKPGDTVIVKGECAGYQMDVLLMRSSLRRI
jgi:hypothetical protein